MFSGLIAATVVKSHCWIIATSVACVHKLPNDGTEAADVKSVSVYRNYVVQWPGVKQKVILPEWWRPGMSLPRHKTPNAILQKYGSVTMEDPKDVVVFPLNNDRDPGNIDAFGTVSH